MEDAMKRAVLGGPGLYEGEWQPWWAWRPVRVEPGVWCWRRNVWRKTIVIATKAGRYPYRFYKLEK